MEGLSTPGIGTLGEVTLAVSGKELLQWSES